MTRRHGIQAGTYDQLILDAGAIYTGFTSLASPGTLLGATRGGAVFKRVPQYAETPYEGIPGQVVGQKHLIGVEVTLEVNIVSFTSANILKSIPNSVSTRPDVDYLKLTETTWNASTVHSLTNIAIIAEVSGETKPVIIVLDNPIAEKDLTLPFTDKSETVSKWEFMAYYKESVGFSDPPWRILWPEVIPN